MSAAHLPLPLLSDSLAQKRPADHQRPEDVASWSEFPEMWVENGRPERLQSSQFFFALRLAPMPEPRGEVPEPDLWIVGTDQVFEDTFGGAKFCSHSALFTAEELPGNLGFERRNPFLSVAFIRQGTGNSTSWDNRGSSLFGRKSMEIYPVRF